jgi:hypothetical protein
MSDPKQKAQFMLGNAILAVCMLMLMFMGTLWQHLGPMAMVLWVVLAAAGVYFVMQDKRDQNLPD